VDGRVNIVLLRVAMAHARAELLARVRNKPIMKCAEYFGVFKIFVFCIDTLYVPNVDIGDLISALVHEYSTGNAVTMAT
jgi:hypothetical protein